MLRSTVSYKLPCCYKPGTDRIGKFVAKNQFTIELITNSLLSVPTRAYTSGDSMFIDDTECGILCLSRSANLANLYLTVAEIQHTMTREFMCRDVQHFHFFLILLKNESKPLGKLFEPIQSRSYHLETPCCLFATSCFMLTKNSVDPIIDNCDSNELDPLVVFAHFMTSGQQSNIGIDRWDNLTVIKLFSAAMKMFKKDREAENAN
ncbi:uncharacterized protein EV154DRAFT_483092 [Mucor mucedo]|uniref:uncharacterized protein n=1 Tax=Mucor mucedo TaxID=29922 RepID=UPI00222017B9|nr:uncharacterized protein EV154DRAFT_483092 [Mucor mucedo]KAI7889505.1 hypothetical protein EV154DRAFT_483092 [Mucor mucedo]